MNYNEEEANADTQKALNVEDMGTHGFLVSGGAYSDPSEYALPQKRHITQRVANELRQFDKVYNLNGAEAESDYDEGDGWSTDI